MNVTTSQIAAVAPDGGATNTSWTATGDVLIQGATLPSDTVDVLLWFYLVAGAAVLFGVVMTLRGRRKVGSATFLTGVVGACALYSTIVFWGHIVGRPTIEASAHYAYSDGNLTTIVEKGDKVIERDVVQGRIVECQWIEFVNGSKAALAVMDNGETRFLRIAEPDMISLIITLREEARNDTPKLSI